MAEWDEKSGKVRPTWEVSFSAWWVFAGSAIAGVVCAAMLFLTFVLPSGDRELNDSGSVLQGGVLLLGAVLAAFLLLGPTLAWGLGFMLRTNHNKWIHVIAFAALGLAVGFMLGELIGLGSVIAPAAGIGAGVGRLVVDGQARVR